MEIKITEDYIQKRLALYFGKYKTANIVVPNIIMSGIEYIDWENGAHYVHLGENYEADLLFISDVGYLKEFEIKISLSDFKNDIEKKYFHDCKYLRQFYYAFPKKLYEDNKDFINAECLKRNAGIVTIGEDTGVTIEIKATIRKVKPLDERFINKIMRAGCIKWYRR